MRMFIDWRTDEEAGESAASARGSTVQQKVPYAVTEIHSQRTPTLNARSIFFLNTNLKN